MDLILSTNSDDEMRSRAFNICRKHLSGAWKRITAGELSLEPISGGMSNTLFRCSLPDSLSTLNGEPTQVLLRLYRDQLSSSEMDTQLEIFNLLSLKDLGPKLYGRFDGGRLEEFLPATSLTSDELMDRGISSIIAKKLASVHSLDVPIDKRNVWLLEKFNEWSEFVDNLGEPQFTEGTQESTIKLAQDLLAIDFSKEIKFLSAILDRTHSPIVFSHNDLHQGNILLAKSSKRRPTLEERIVFIDFEYSSYNYRAFDIANHLCEWCFQYDTPEYPHFNFFEARFPDEEVQYNFVRNYINQKRSLDNLLKGDSLEYSNDFNHNLNNNGESCKDKHCDNGNPINGTHHKVNGNHVNGHSNSTTLDAEMVALYKEYQPFFMIANFLWTLWCIRTAQTSTIKFGYWEHASARWQLYNKLKANYMGSGKASNGISMNL